MRLLLCLVVIIFTGCSTVSDYSQGCRDGLDGIAKQIADILSEYKLKPIYNTELRDEYCDQIDRERNQENKTNRGRNK